MKYFGIFIVVLYLLLGLILVLAADRYFKISDTQKMILGILFITYAVFRGYRVYVKYFKRNEDK